MWIDIQRRTFPYSRVDTSPMGLDSEVHGYFPVFWSKQKCRVERKWRKYGTNEKPHRVSVLLEGGVALPWTPEEDVGLHLVEKRIIFLKARLIWLGLTSRFDELHSTRKRVSGQRNWGRRCSCPFERPIRRSSRYRQRASVIHLQWGL